jgi:hypothetical protein
MQDENIGIFEVTCPSGAVAKLREWITAREGRAIREIPFKHAKMGSTSDVGPGGSIVQGAALKDIDVAAMQRETDEAVLTAVLVSYDSTGGPEAYQRVMDGRDCDYVFLLAEATKVVENPTTGK